jgi:hypothetical protein
MAQPRDMRRRILGLTGDPANDSNDELRAQLAFTDSKYDYLEAEYEYLRGEYFRMGLELARYKEAANSDEPRH